MLKQRLNLSTLKVSSFVTEVTDSSSQTIKGGTDTNWTYAICETNNGCGGTEYEICPTEARCPKDIPTYP